MFYYCNIPNINLCTLSDRSPCDTDQKKDTKIHNDRFKCNRCVTFNIKIKPSFTIVN